MPDLGLANPGLANPRLANQRVAIVGLGLMGGSLAWVLHGKCRLLLGVDKDSATVAAALQSGIFSRVSTQASELLPEADLVILATPVAAIIQILSELPALHPSNAVIFDLGSTKAGILEEMNKLPERFDPVGGHPMCGKETSSFAEADPGIYRNARFALVPLARTTNSARMLVEQVVSAAGSLPLWLDAAAHDLWTACTSHLPYLVANSLAGVTPLEFAALVGSGFRDTTRLASANLEVMLDILLSNRINILSAGREYQQRFSSLLAALELQDRSLLADLLSQGADQRRRLLDQRDLSVVP